MESFEQQSSKATDSGLPFVLLGLQIPTVAAPQLPGPQAVVPLIKLESQDIMNALEHTGGNTALTAWLLGIGRTTLYRKVKQYQLGAQLFYSRRAGSSG